MSFPFIEGVRGRYPDYPGWVWSALHFVLIDRRVSTSQFWAPSDTNHKNYLVHSAGRLPICLGSALVSILRSRSQEVK